MVFNSVMLSTVAFELCSFSEPQYPSKLLSYCAWLVLHAVSLGGRPKLPEERSSKVTCAARQRKDMRRRTMPLWSS